MAAPLRPMNVTVKPEELRAGILRYCESLRVKDAPNYGVYRFGRGKQPTYWASAFVAMTRYLMDDLDSLTGEQKSQWRQYLIDGQDEETGLYIDPTFKSAERLSAKHTDELLFWHSSTFIMTSVDLLGGVCKYPVNKTRQLFTPEGMRQFILGLPWKLNPWVAGNWTYDIGCLVGHDWRVTKNQSNLDAMDWFFDWMKENQNKQTGWWDIVGGHPISHQQYGGYHTLMVYWMFGREVPNPELMIDSSLSLQNKLGHFGGGCCPDMDCADAVVTLSRQYNIREKEVRAAMERLLPWTLHTWDRESGSFLEYDQDNSGVYGKRNEFGWVQCTTAENEPDPCSASFRGFTLACISEMVSGTGFDKLPWKHHGSFGHCVRPKSLLRK